MPAARSGVVRGSGAARLSGLGPFGRRGGARSGSGYSLDVAALVTRRRSLVALVAVAFVIALVFGGRAGWRLYHRLTGPPPPSRQTDVSAIAGWMTVPYVGRAYRVPPPELFGALGVSEQGRRTSTLDDIARETGRSSADVLDTLRVSVSAWQAANPSKPGGPGPGGTGPGPPPR